MLAAALVITVGTGLAGVPAASRALAVKEKR
jgi:hypothetical protein